MREESDLKKEKSRCNIVSLTPQKKRRHDPFVVTPEPEEGKEKKGRDARLRSYLTACPKGGAREAGLTRFACVSSLVGRKEGRPIKEMGLRVQLAWSRAGKEIRGTREQPLAQGGAMNA